MSSPSKMLTPTPTPIPNPNPNPNPTEHWTIVSHRRKHRPRPSIGTLPPSIPNPETLTLTSPIPWSPLLPHLSSPTLHSALLSKLRSSLTRLKSSQFFARFIAQFRSPLIQSPLSRHPHLHFVVYGIGSIESYETARLQLSLALLICDQLKPKLSSVQLFDPILSFTECAVIEELGFEVLRVDEQARREAKAPTLFFMPHCEVHLYDNLLGANWGKKGGRLGRVVILGNSFGAYERNVEAAGGSRRVGEAGRRVIGAKGFVREVVVEGGDDQGDGFFRAFHDISWHFFDVGDGDLY